ADRRRRIAAERQRKRHRRRRRCWGGWIRTTDYLIQSQEPYRLATPQWERDDYLRALVPLNPPMKTSISTRDGDVGHELDQHRAELTAYCYRMLASPFEAEDA